MDKDVKDDALKLQDEVAKKYEVKAGKVRKFFSSKFGMVDLNKVTLAGAKPFVDAGYLIPKEKETKGATAKV